MHRRRRTPIVTRIVSGVLATCVVVSTLGLLTLAVATASGRVRIAPILTGSMAPNAPRGSIVVARPVPVDDLQVGDVLLFNAPVEGHPLVVHRISKREDGPQGPVFHTKGDANDTPDLWAMRITDERAWRVTRIVPRLGSAVALFTEPWLRVAVLVTSVLLIVVAGMRRIWTSAGPDEPEQRDQPDARDESDEAEAPEDLWGDVWGDVRGSDEHEKPALLPRRAPGGRRVRRLARRRSRRRAAGVMTVGATAVAVLATTGLAHALFTSTPIPADQPVTSGLLPAPTGLTCRWASATSLTTSWNAVSSGGFALGYDVQRSNTSGSGYASVGTVTPETTTTFIDTAPGPPTLRYYVVTSYRGAWDSAASNEVVSNTCTGAVNLAAGTSAGFSGDTGAATSAQLNTPSGVAVDGTGNVYIADTTNNRIRKVIAATGVITTVAGTGTAGSTGDGGAATSARLNAPRGVAVDSTGNVYIADTGSHKVRKITVATGVITTIAGSGTSGSTGDGGAATAARLNAPRGVAVDSGANVYIADTGNSRIRKVTMATGVISLLAGSGANTACTYSGTATTVSLSAPGGVAVDSTGNVYIADTNRNCIRKVSGTTVSRVAGGGATTTCTTVAATSVSLSAPSGVAVDSSGRVVFSDNGRRCVRMVSGTNVVTIAGTGTSGSTGDNGPAVGALFSTPAAVVTDASGDVWIADTGTHRIRRVEGPL